MLIRETISGDDGLVSSMVSDDQGCSRVGCRIKEERQGESGRPEEQQRSLRVPYSTIDLIIAYSAAEGCDSASGVSPPARSPTESRSIPASPRLTASRADHPLRHVLQITTLLSVPYLHHRASWSPTWSPYSIKPTWEAALRRNAEPADPGTRHRRRAAWVPVELPGLGRGTDEHTPRSG